MNKSDVSRLLVERRTLAEPGALVQKGAEELRVKPVFSSTRREWALLDRHWAVNTLKPKPGATASTAAMLAICDALALVAMEERGFSKEDFALRHHGGYLGIVVREEQK